MNVNIIIVCAANVCMVSFGCENSIQIVDNCVVAPAVSKNCTERMNCEAVLPNESEEKRFNSRKGKRKQGSFREVQSRTDFYHDAQCKNSKRQIISASKSNIKKRNQKR